MDKIIKRFYRLFRSCNVFFLSISFLFLGFDFMLFRNVQSYMLNSIWKVKITVKCGQLVCFGSNVLIQHVLETSDYCKPSLSDCQSSDYKGWFTNHLGNLRETHRWKHNSFNQHPKLCHFCSEITLKKIAMMEI